MLRQIKITLYAIDVVQGVNHNELMSKAKNWFLRAQKEKFAIGAFNAASIETLKAVVMAAKNLKSPVMIETSHGEVSYFGVRELVGVVHAMEQSHGIPILLNLDHSPDFDKCKEAIDFGFDYVHLDGSKLPLDENIRQTKEIVEYAHTKDVLVEGEIDNINVMGAASADNRQKDINSVRSPEYYTNPDKALEFVQATGIDTFASFIGNVHGLYSGTKNINLDLLRDIKIKLGDTFLSLHGGSGIPDNEVSAAIGVGIQKVNVNSELRVSFYEKLKEIMARPSESEVAIYKIMPEAILAMQKIVEEKIKLFGSAGKAV